MLNLNSYRDFGCEKRYKTWEIERLTSGRDGEFGKKTRSDLSRHERREGGRVT